MTRKRFVKLMMALGYSRNEANELAERARRYGQSYAARWAYEKCPKGALTRAQFFVSKSAIKAGRVLGLFRKNIGDAAMMVGRMIAAGIMTPNEARQNAHLHQAGLRADVALVDEVAASDPPLTHEQIKVTTATWPGHVFLAGIDYANGPDVAAEIHVAGGDADGD